MSAKNNATFIGHLGRDAEARWIANSEKQITGFSIAVETGWGDRKKTMWVNVNAWGGWIDKLTPHLTKGTLVAVNGEVELKEWEKDGVTRSNLQITVAQGGIELLGGKGEKSTSSSSQGFRQREPERAPEQGSLPTGQSDFVDDDIPF